MMARRVQAMLLLLSHVSISAGESCVSLNSDESRSWGGGFQLTIKVDTHYPFERITVKFAEPSEEGITLKSLWSATVVEYDGVHNEGGKIPAIPVHSATFDVKDLKQMTQALLDQQAERVESYDINSNDKSYDHFEEEGEEEEGEDENDKEEEQMDLLKHRHEFQGGFGLIGGGNAQIDVESLELR